MPDLVTCDWHGNDPHGEIAACRNPRPVFTHVEECSLGNWQDARDCPHPTHEPIRIVEWTLTDTTGEELAAAFESVREIQARYIELRRQYEAVQRERRDAMKLAHDSGASYQDLADILGVNRQTVAKMLRKP